jgi:Putative Actinobacterial Holin-X, holin superfamily III
MNAPVDPAVAREGPRLADLSESLLRNARDLAVDYAVLAVLDARRAAVRLGWLLAAGLVAAVLAVTAWLALVVAVVVALTDDGTSWAAVLALAAAANVGVAAGLGLWIKGRVRELPFAATLRQLRGEPPAPGPAEGTDARA